jgi:hypothetical protein
MGRACSTHGKEEERIQRFRAQAMRKVIAIKA